MTASPASRAWLRWYAASAIGWTIVALFFTSEGMLADRMRGRPVDALDTLVYSLQFYGCWAAVTPVAWWLAQRWPWRHGAHVAFFARHLPAAIVIAIAQCALFVALFWPRYAGVDGTPATVMRDMLASHLHANVVIYALIVAGAIALAAMRALREREVHAERLRGELARASLAALRLQLQPHFLFNTLNGITALIADEPDKAERMIARLATLLRRSLDGASADAVTLAQELDTLATYLAIERERFEDRLAVTIAIDDDCAAAIVPGMILQPLVENAIRHGIGRRARAGTIAIGARRVGDALVIDVADDGPGWRAPDDAPREAGHGIGLDNTRERLAALHGDAASLAIAANASGGTTVTLSLPWRTTSAATR